MQNDIEILKEIRKQVLSAELFTSKLVLPAVVTENKGDSLQKKSLHIHDLLELRLLFEPWQNDKYAFCSLQEICLTPPEIPHELLQMENLYRHITVRIGANELYYLRGTGLPVIIDTSCCAKLLGVCVTDLVNMLELAGFGKIADEDYVRILVATLLSVVIASMENQGQLPTNQVADLIAAFIRSNYFRDNLSIKEIAEKIRLSPNYIQIVFRKRWGCTPVQYLNEVRLKNAQLLLKKHKYQIKEVAAMCGWNYVHYFCKRYREYFGHLPSEE